MAGLETNCYITAGWRENNHHTSHLQTVYMNLPLSRAWNLFLQFWLPILVHVKRSTKLFITCTIHKYKHGNTLTDQISNLEEIESRMNSENVRYHLDHTLLSSYPLSKNIKIQTYITTTLPVVVYGHVTLCHTLRVCENRVLKDIWAYEGRRNRTLKQTSMIKSFIICRPTAH
jgi:hypothetical protein